MADLNQLSFDPLLPPEMAQKAEAIGAAKARQDPLRLFVLAVLAGAFIAFGAVFATLVLTGSSALPLGVARLLAGLVFSLGLILVIVGGAELFTGDNLMVMALAGGKIGLGEMLRAWGIVYAGNLLGALGVAIMVVLSGDHSMGGGAVGDLAVRIAEAKMALPVPEAFILGLLCNVLVCLAVWLTFAARTVTDKILCIIPPISAFVAAGFEHSIANMYFIPVGLLLGWRSGGDVGLAELGGFVGNLVPVTLGNIIGGGLFVGAVYWFVYLRKS